MKVWDRVGIELATPGSAVRLASVARHVTDCATRPGLHRFYCNLMTCFFADLSNMYSLLKPIHGGLSVLISEVEGNIKTTSFTVIL